MAEVNGMEAMRQTLTTLGIDAKPDEVKEHLKKTFGVDLGKNFSNYKSMAKKAVFGKEHKAKKKKDGSADKRTVHSRANATAEELGANGTVKDDGESLGIAATLGTMHISEETVSAIKKVKQLKAELGSARICAILQLLD